MEDKGGVEKVLLCQGQVYYDLVNGRALMETVEQQKVSIVRVEELAPFPY